MRINDKRRAENLGERRGAAAPATATPSPGGFGAAFQASAARLQRQSLDRQLQPLRERLERAAEALRQEPTLEAYETYRRHLGELLRRLSDSAYQAVRVGEGWNLGEYRQVIATIDREAEALLQRVLADQSERIAIVAGVSRIHGLLVDLFQ